MTLPGAFLSSRRKKWWHHTWLAWAYFNHIMRSCKPCYFACFFVCTPSKKRYSSYTGCAKPSQAITTCKVSRQQPLARDTKKEKQHRCRACGISASFQGRMFSFWCTHYSTLYAHATYAVPSSAARWGAWRILQKPTPTIAYGFYAPSFFPHITISLQ